MGNLFKKQKRYQDQFNTCDICNNNEIKMKSFTINPDRFGYKGVVCFMCKNKHCFYKNYIEFGCSVNEVTESIYQRFQYPNG